MIRRLFVLVLLSVVVLGSCAFILPTRSASLDPCAQDHEVWLTHVLQKMDSIKPGMTRGDLLKVFRTEGGLSTGLRRTFVSRDCLYCKVVVEFKPVARADSNNPVFMMSPEDSRDIIVKVSKPYLQFSIAD